MQINRNKYLNQLISKKENGLIKIVTGIRRSGKSYLLFELYHKYLVENEGVDEDCIIEISLDDLANIKYRNPFELDKFIREKIEKEDNLYYVFIDEIQMVESVDNPYVTDGRKKITFVDVLLGLIKMKNVDLYITGSNSKMLSSDILTEFRGRGDEIKMAPLSYRELYDCFDNKNNAWKEYVTYGGMPYLVSLTNHQSKSKYLIDLFNKIYLEDIVERNKISASKETLSDLLNLIATAVGLLTNPLKLSKTFKSVKQITITSATISKYLDYFIDSFLISKSYRYDVKGKRYLDTPLKYYYSDIGLRNAMLNFRQQEENHIMENIIYNELIGRGFNVDVGVVEYNYKDENGLSKRKQFEIDFVANQASKRYYIQSALSIVDEEKKNQEVQSLLRVDDSFKKIVIVKDDIIPWHDENGILFIGVENFLLNDAIIDY
ncbi:ATP-binding protein [Anaerorhabdus furcosa]|uniref:AAA domain-containing protein n=1 Tax=Anaerorhabdus furcosa TaxID=118967 RepID=A0A1T4K8T9_9FIRM|nr:ATP-binding protein [Anaerorhabdus furcosa]SJZ38844.1 hypothetical protein SAMN02745191_0400 [Anaerorhabdus furcosa]